MHINPGVNIPTGRSEKVKRCVYSFSSEFVTLGCVYAVISGNTTRHENSNSECDMKTNIQLSG